MTRLFLHGRTETVRPLTAEAIAFVTAMGDASATPRAKLTALQVAAKRHVREYCDAMSGHGIDRHLFALYCVSVGRGIDSPFLKAALSVPWKLSTSQQPQQQTTLWDIKDPKNARKVRRTSLAWCGGARTCCAPFGVHQSRSERLTTPPPPA